MPNCLVVYAHPNAESLCATTRARAVDRLTSLGMKVTVHDLYGARFDPVLTAEEWNHQRTGESLTRPYDNLRADLAAADHLVLVFPTWWYGFPAILKGYLDRVWSPELAFAIRDGRMIRARLGRVRSVTVATTGGSPWWWMVIAMREPLRRTLTIGLRPLLGRHCAFHWIACYGLDRPNQRRIARYLGRLDQVLRKISEMKTV